MEESIMKSSSHIDSMGTSTTSLKPAPENPENLQSDLSVSDNLINENILKNIEASMETLDAQEGDESNKEKSDMINISQPESLEIDAQSQEIEGSTPLETTNPLDHMKNSVESNVKSISDIENFKAASQSDELASPTQSNNLSEGDIIEEDHPKVSEGEEIAVSNNSIIEQQASSDISTNIDDSLQTSERNQHLEIADNYKPTEEGQEHSTTPVVNLMINQHLLKINH